MREREQHDTDDNGFRWHGPLWRASRHEDHIGLGRLRHVGYHVHHGTEHPRHPGVLRSPCCRGPQPDRGCGQRYRAASDQGGLDSFGRNARRHHRRNPALPSALRGLCPCFGLSQGRPTDGRGRADTDPASPHPALYARRPTAAHAPRRTKHLLQCGGGLSEPKLLHRGGTGAGRTVCQGNDGTHGGATGTKHGTLPGVCLGSGATCEDQ